MSPEPKFKAKKSLGQHFLRNPAICERIVALVDPQAQDQILEIGPGPGALTSVLRQAPFAKLLLLEKDDAFARLHRDLGQPQVEVAHQDALAFAWPDLAGPWKIVGNLPYNVASPLIWDIVSLVPQLERAVVMTQKEVAERIVAAPGSKTYGALSVWVQSFVRAEKCFNLGPGSFSPPPKVDSSVLRFFPLAPDLLPANPEALKKIIKTSFAQRRKQLRHVLSRGFAQTYDDNILISLGISPQDRPENLNPALFQALARALVQA